MKTPTAPLVLASAVCQWTLMIGASLTRMDEGIAEPSTLVYLTIVCSVGLLAAEELVAIGAPAVAPLLAELRAGAVFPGAIR